MTIITPAILRELCWLARSGRTVVAIDRAVLVELISAWKDRPQPGELTFAPDPVDQLDHWLDHTGD